MQSHIYIISARNTGCCKVGVSERPLRRMYELQIGCPSKLALEFSICADPDLVEWTERALHRHLQDRRTSGEWFRISVDRAVTLLGFTSLMAHGYREDHGLLPNDYRRIFRRLPASRERCGYPESRAVHYKDNRPLPALQAPVRA